MLAYLIKTIKLTEIVCGVKSYIGLNKKDEMRHQVAGCK